MGFQLPPSNSPGVSRRISGWNHQQPLKFCGARHCQGVWIQDQLLSDSPMSEVKKNTLLDTLSSCRKSMVWDLLHQILSQNILDVHALQKWNAC